MAPTFPHGKGSRVLFNTRDLSNILNSFEVTRTAAVHDVTCYVTSTGGQTTDNAYLPGLKDGVATLEGLSDGSTAKLDQVLSTALAAATKPVISLGPGGAAVGDPAILAQADMTDFTITSPAKDVVAVTAKVQASMMRVGGWWLATPTAPSTSTGGLTGIIDRTISTAAGSSTRGGVAHCHIVSATTSTGVVKVQHSTDGASWSDLISFTISSGRSVQRSTVAGSVKERIRGNVHQASTAGFTVGLTFARHTI